MAGTTWNELAAQAYAAAQDTDPNTRAWAQKVIATMADKLDAQDENDRQLSETIDKLERRLDAYYAAANATAE